jgi:uncharacterized repeat protein (TIGR03943 family)
VKTASKYLAPLALAEWGGIMLYFYIGGRIASFLHPMFRPMVLVTGLLLLGAAAIVVFARRDVAGCACEEHSHGRSGFFAFLILMVPFALAAKISPDGYGTNFVAQKMVQPAALIEPDVPPDVEPPLPTEDGAPAPTDDRQPAGNDYLRPDKNGNIHAEVTDLAFAAQEETMRRDFDGKRVEIIGQFVPEPEKPDSGRFQLVRFVMVCCAADVQPAFVLVEKGENAARFREMSWVKVVGTVAFPSMGGQPMAVITATSITQTPEPADKYLY